MMRGTVWGLLGVAITVLGGAGLPAAEKEGPEAVIDRGINAVGGREKLQKFAIGKCATTGTYYGMGEFNFDGEYKWGPHLRQRLEVPGLYIGIVNDNQAWVSLNGSTEDLLGDRLKGVRRRVYGHWVANLFPIKDSGAKLSMGEDAMVDSKPAVTVKVEKDDLGPVTLFFDKGSGRLVKWSCELFSDELQKEVKHEVMIKSWMNTDGVELPQKVSTTRDGERYMEEELSNYVAMDKVNDADFQKP